MGRERALQAHQDQMLRFLGIHHYFSAPVQHLTISFSRSSRRRGSGGVEGAPSRFAHSFCLVLLVLKPSFTAFLLLHVLLPLSSRVVASSFAEGRKVPMSDKAMFHRG
mmetsp:Transcript_23855/g.60319  ORF Transcript_23855/g.60319 Transcript_23855/m.60319 type:complete len:108 (+) Transcript_23855:480-803(+)